MAGADQIHQVPTGRRHRTEVLQGSSGQTVSGACLSCRSGSKFHTFSTFTVRAKYEGKLDKFPQILLLFTSLSFWMQPGSDVALLQGCFSDPEDLPHGGGQTAVPHDPTGHRHHPGLRQGCTGAPQIQTGQHLTTSVNLTIRCLW